MPPLDEAVSRVLGRAAEALAANDLELAAAAADTAATAAPDRPEPIEVQFLVALGSGRPADVRATVARLADTDPRNAIPIAFAGLEAVQNGDHDGALSALAWFIGPDALPRRGSAVPLPTAVGELEEQCALSALRLGYAVAAQAAIDAAAAAFGAEPRALARLDVLRAEALLLLGREADSVAILDRVPGASSASRGSNELSSAEERALTYIAAIRRDEILHSRGRGGEALDEAVAAFERDWSDAVAVLRIARLTSVADTGLRRRLWQRVGVRTANDPASALRFATVRAILMPSEAHDELAAAVAADPSDRVALRFALRSFARQGLDRAVASACEAVSARPNDLDGVSRSLLGCGATVEAVLLELERPGHGVAGDAIRSRIYARFGFAEDAFAIADAARGRDRASTVALAACAFAAADLRDETLLAEVDDDALASGAALARTLASCWYRVGDFTRAHDRAQRALRHDPADVRARLLEAVSCLAAGEASAGERAEAFRLIRTAATERGVVAGDAYAFLTRFGREGDGAGALVDRLEGASIEPGQADGSTRARRMPSPREAVPALLAAAQEFDRIRHPFALECLALADEIDPGEGATDALVAHATRGGSSDELARWASAMLAEAPALPSRRRVRAALLDPNAGGEVPTGPLSARFDALELASDGARARDRAERATMRPRTLDATIARAEALLEAGDASAAAAALESIAASTSGVVAPRAARRALEIAQELVSTHPEHSDAMRRFAIEMAVRLAVAGPEDIHDVLKVAILSRIGPTEVESLATILAKACRVPSEAPKERLSQLFVDLLAVDGDPFPPARMANALAREVRFEPALRGFLGNAAVALQAASGGPASESLSLLRALFDAGAPAFVREEDSGTSLATSLLRAASAYSLVGDMAGSDQLLRAAISADPNLAEASNNLAFSRIESGIVDAETIALAETAARLAPDDAAILDTLGVVRYHQGRLRDDAGGPGAITLFRQALRVDPDDPSLATFDHLGDALWRDGDQAGAVRCWQQVEQVAKLRYPPEAMAQGLAAFQRREFGVGLVSPAEFVRREFGRVVDRAERKLQEVARGAPPSVAPCLASP